MENQTNPEPTIPQSAPSPAAPPPVMSPHPATVPATSDRNALSPVTLILAVAVLILGGLTLYFWQQANAAQTQLDNINVTLQALPTPTPTFTTPSPTMATQAADMTDWKTYTIPGIASFQYPGGTWMVAENAPRFYAIYDSSLGGPPGPISIDARTTDVPFAQTVQRLKSGLTDVQEETLSNRTIIRGKLGPGFGEGDVVRYVVLKYKDAGIVAETLVGTTYEAVFDQILSTFSFTP